MKRRSSAKLLVIEAAVHGRNAAMQNAITAGQCLARLAKLTDWNLLISLWPVALRIARLVAGFRNDEICPTSMWDLRRS